MQDEFIIGLDSSVTQAFPILPSRDDARPEIDIVREVIKLRNNRIKVRYRGVENKNVRLKFEHINLETWEELTAHLDLNSPLYVKFVVHGKVILDGYYNLNLLTAGSYESRNELVYDGVIVDFLYIK